MYIYAVNSFQDLNTCILLLLEHDVNSFQDLNTCIFMLLEHVIFILQEGLWTVRYPTVISVAG